MTGISTEELYDLFVDTVERCKSETLGLSDGDIEYNLFEEFDVGVQSFLHESCLGKLYEEGLIDDESRRLSREVRAKWFQLQQRQWTLPEIRTAKEWQELMHLCDAISAKLQERG